MRTRLKGLDQKLSGDAFVAAAAGNAIEADVNHLPLVWCEEPIRFNTPDGHKKLLHIAEEVHKHMLDKFGVPLVLIIFDTMGASVDFKDANATEENQHVMNRLNAISRVTNTFVLVVDHFGKNVDVGTKNSGTKEDNADLVLAMLCDRDVGGSISNTRMKIRKLRRGKSGTEFPFDLTVVDIGDGETTCSISWKKERSDSAHTSSKSWTKTLQVFRTVMEVMTLDRSAEMRPYGSEGPIVKAVELSVARTEFMLAYPSDAEDQRAREAAKRSAFNRALKDARNRMLICSRDIDGKDYLWLMNEEVTDYLRKKGA